MQAAREYRMLVDFRVVARGRIMHEAFDGEFLKNQSMTTHYFNYKTLREVVELLEFFTGNGCKDWVAFGGLKSLVSSGAIREKLFKYEITHQIQQGEQVDLAQDRADC